MNKFNFEALFRFNFVKSHLNVVEDLGSAAYYISICTLTIPSHGFYQNEASIQNSATKVVVIYI